MVHNSKTLLIFVELHDLSPASSFPLFDRIKPSVAPRYYQRPLLDQHTHSPNTLPLRRRLLRFQDLLHARLKIHLHRIPRPLVSPEHNPVDCIHDNEDRYANVIRQKAAGRPLTAEEHSEAIGETENGEHDHSNPAAVGLDEVAVRRYDALGIGGFAEADEYDCAADPGYQAPCVGKL